MPSLLQSLQVFSTGRKWPNSFVRSVILIQPGLPCIHLSSESLPVMASSSHNSLLTMWLTKKITWLCLKVDFSPMKPQTAPALTRIATTTLWKRQNQPIWLPPNSCIVFGQPGTVLPDTFFGHFVTWQQVTRMLIKKEWRSHRWRLWKLSLHPNNKWNRNRLKNQQFFFVRKREVNTGRTAAPGLGRLKLELEKWKEERWYPQFYWLQGWQARWQSRRSSWRP